MHVMKFPSLFFKKCKILLRVSIKTYSFLATLIHLLSSPLNVMQSQLLVTQDDELIVPFGL